MHHLPQGAGEAEDPSSFGAADAEPGRREEGEVPIRGVAILDPLEVKHPFFFPRFPSPKCQQVKRSIVYPNYPTSSMSFILQVVNILVYLHAFIYAFMGHDGISHAVHLRSVCELGNPPDGPFFSKQCREFAMEWMEHRKR